MNVCLSTTKTLRGATIDMLAHVTFLVGIREKIPKNSNEKNTMHMLCILACPRIVKRSISV